MSGESGGRGLVDTNILIHLPALHPEQLPEEILISSVTLAELSAGPHYTDDVRERALRMSVLQHAEATFEPLPFDAESARMFGLASAAVLAVGRTPRRRTADLMIASVAAANKLPLYTANPDDFVGLADLLMVVPVARPVAAP